MKSNARFNLVSVAVVTLVSSLAACGGGGSATVYPSAPVVIADVVASTGTLQTSVPASTYAVGGIPAGAFAMLNVVRQGAGAGFIAQSAAIDIAASAHATYFTNHLADAISPGHFEDATKPDYYEYSVGSRVAKSGFGANLSTEVIGGGGSATSNTILGFLSTVYHGVAVLGPYTNVGMGMGTDGANRPLIVSDMASLATSPYPQVPASGALIAYPYPGQTTTFANFYAGNEIPRIPVALFPNAMAGTPIIVSVRNADYVNYKSAGTLVATVTNFTLKDASGNLVPSKILSASNIQAATGVTLNTDIQLVESFIVLVPIAPLAQSQTYTASFSATLKTGGAPIAKTWAFTTSATN